MKMKEKKAAMKDDDVEGELVEQFDKQDLDSSPDELDLTLEQSSAFKDNRNRRGPHVPPMNDDGRKNNDVERQHGPQPQVGTQSCGDSKLPPPPLNTRNAGATSMKRQPQNRTWGNMDTKSSSASLEKHVSALPTRFGDDEDSGSQSESKPLRRVRKNNRSKAGGGPPEGNSGARDALGSAKNDTRALLPPPAELTVSPASPVPRACKNIGSGSDGKQYIDARKGMELNKMEMKRAMDVKKIAETKKADMKKFPETRKAPEIKLSSEVKKSVDLKKGSEIKKPVEVKASTEITKRTEAKKGPESKKNSETRKTFETAKSCEVKKTTEGKKVASSEVKKNAAAELKKASAAQVKKVAAAEVKKVVAAEVKKVAAAEVKKVTTKKVEVKKQAKAEVVKTTAVVKKGDANKERESAEQPDRVKKIVVDDPVKADKTVKKVVQKTNNGGKEEKDLVSFLMETGSILALAQYLDEED
jgi:hypothetical protein